MSSSLSDVRRLLVVKPSSLGDIVHALPTVAALRRRWPSAKLSWLVKREWAEVLEGNPDVDDILAVDLSIQGWPDAIRMVRAGAFDLIVDLQGLLRSALLGWLSGAPNRVGFANGREGSPWFYSQRVPVPNAVMHAVDRYLLVAQSLGASMPNPDMKNAFPLPGDAAAEARIDALLAAAGVQPDTALIGINPSARWATKRWPAESFAAVGDRLQRDGARAVVLGGEDERPVGQAVSRAMEAAPIDLSGKTTVKELIALLRRVRVLITNDSGPMHLAAAVGTPVIALFGPTDPARTGPYGAGHTVLRNRIPCSPCFSRRCVNSIAMECLTAISPQQVIESSTKLLKGDAVCQSTRNC